MDELVEYLRDDKGREKCKAMTDHFPCSKDCPCALELRVISDAARIEALEAQVRAADALAEAHLAIVETTEGLAGTIIQECRQISRKALAAYRATKEGGA